MNFEERLVLEDLWIRQESISQIARYLGRSRYEIEQELKRGNVIYFKGLDDHELKLMTIHKRIKYSAEYAQQFVTRTKMVHEERHKLTPGIKRFIENKLSEGLSPETIVRLYSDEVPITGRMIRNYIDQGLIQKHVHNEDALLKMKNKGEVVLNPVHRNQIQEIVFGQWLVFVKKEVLAYQRVSILVLIEELTHYVVLVRLEDKDAHNVYLGLELFLDRFISDVYMLDFWEEVVGESQLLALKATYDVVFNHVVSSLVPVLEARLEIVLKLIPDYENLVYFEQLQLDNLSRVLNERLFLDTSETIASVFKKVQEREYE
ncbi:helix-turn-helix domain-containing protein [Weissella viridescens]|nr:helix-turn-helix domain-containing protein [Weissella viridescens]